MLNYFYLCWFYVKRHFHPPLKLKGCWLKAWTLRTASSLCMHECLFYIHPVNQCGYIKATTNLYLWYEWHWCHNSSVAWLECEWVQLNHMVNEQETCQASYQQCHWKWPVYLIFFNISDPVSEKPLGSSCTSIKCNKFHDSMSQVATASIQNKE